jgi:hypothetical protein
LCCCLVHSSLASNCELKLSSTQISCFSRNQPAPETPPHPRCTPRGQAAMSWGSTKGRIPSLKMYPDPDAKIKHDVGILARGPPIRLQTLLDPDAVFTSVYHVVSVHARDLLLLWCAGACVCQHVLISNVKQPRIYAWSGGVRCVVSLRRVQARRRRLRQAVLGEFRFPLHAPKLLQYSSPRLRPHVHTPAPQPIDVRLIPVLSCRRLKRQVLCEPRLM